MSGIAIHQSAVMIALGENRRTLDELEAHLPISRRSIVKATGKLIERHYVEREKAGVYRLTETGSICLTKSLSLKSGPRGRHTGAQRPNRDTFRQRAWSAMRMTPRFTQPDILVLAAQPEDGNAEASLQRWVLRLIRGGYVVQLPTRAPGTAPTSNGHKVYRLMRNTGELAPIYQQRDSLLRDMNTGEEFPCQ